MDRASARWKRGKGSLVPGATTEEETFAMFTFDYDPVTPAAGELIAELGLDERSVRDALADDRARRCPDREVPASGR